MFFTTIVEDNFTNSLAWTDFYSCMHYSHYEICMYINVCDACMEISSKGEGVYLTIKILYLAFYNSGDTAQK